MLQGNWERAAAQYEAFLAENPGDAQRAEIRMQAGKCRLGGGNVESAIRSFDQALLDQPPGHIRWEILFRRAVAYRVLGDAARSVEGFRTVMSAPSSERGRTVTNDELHYEYAIALFRSGDFKSGQAELKLVGASGPYGRLAAPRLGLTGYSVQVGAFASQDNALKLADDLNARGYARVRVERGDETPRLYHVRFGNYPDQARASRAGEEVAATLGIDFQIVPPPPGIGH